MSQERREILEMVADGTLSVEEAERLLDALTEGERKEAGARERGRRPGRGDRGGRRSSGWLDLQLSNLGEDAVKDRLRAATRRGKGRPIPAPNGRFPVPEESVLLVRNDPHHPGGGSMTLRRAPGEECEVECEGPFQVTRSGEAVRVEWEYGDIDVAVPDAVGALEARTHGGNLEVEGIRAPMKLLTLGGDVNLSGLCREVDAVTNGGNVWVEVDGLEPGTRSKVVTQHGDVFVKVGPEFTGVVKAGSLSGTVQVEEDLGRVHETSRLVTPRNVTVEIGPQPRIAEIALQTLHGNLFVERQG